MKPKKQLTLGSIIVEADRARIIRGISNLLSNALKFTKKEEGGSIYVMQRRRRTMEKQKTGSYRLVLKALAKV